MKEHMQSYRASTLQNVCLTEKNGKVLRQKSHPLAEKNLKNRSRIELDKNVRFRDKK